MSSVDERVVQMQFQNAEFERGVQQTIASLERLKKGLQLQGAAKGLTEVATASQQFDQHITRNRDSLGRFTTEVSKVATTSDQFGQKLEANKGFLDRFVTGVDRMGTSIKTFGTNVASGSNSVGKFFNDLNKTSGEAEKQKSSLKNLENGVQSLANRFSTLGSMATGALMNIGARAQEAGMRFANSFTFGPIMQGFQEYETNMNSIQTILANTQSAGTNLKDVTKALDELNHYSDQTIYNFSEMAKNIGTFTAAGVALEPATAAIKGIANLAALSGSNSEQASGAMYQLSQAISAGRVTLEDWNSVVNAGMGGTVFQRALAMNAEKMGTLSKGAVKLTGEMKNVTIGGKSFRESITAKPGQESWLTSKVLTQTLAQFTGDLSDAELAAQGFSKAQIKMIQDQAKMAKSAATEVKTLTQLFGTFKEQLGSGWAQTWQIIFGDFAEAKGLFTGISDSVGKMLQNSSDARNKMLKDWDALGGRKALIEGITNTFKALGSVLGPIKDGFRDVFPATTGKQLADMTKQFRDFTESLKVGSETGDKLRRTFAGVFAIFGIAFDIISAVVGAIFDLVGVATEGSGGFLDLTAKIGDFLVKLREALKNGETFKNIFKGIATVLSVPIRALQVVGLALAELFKDIDGSPVIEAVEKLSDKLKPLGDSGEKVGSIFATIGENVVMFASKASDFFQKIFEWVSQLVSGLDLQDVFAGINTGLLTGFFLMIRNVIGGGGLGGIMESFSDAAEKMTGILASMQTTLRAATLLQIAIAIGILALAMNTLSKIPREDLMNAAGAITFLFTQLLGALLIFEKLSGFTGFAKMPFVALSMILLAAAVNILASAMEKMSELDWNGIAKGLTGVTGLLGALIATSHLMKNPMGLILTGAAMSIMAIGIKSLATAVAELAGLSWEEMARGLVGVGVLIGALMLFAQTTSMNVKGLVSGIVVAMLAASIKTLAMAIKDLAKLSWDEIARGLTVMAAGLAMISASLKLIPPSSILSAAAVIMVAASLGMLSTALKDMAEMSWGDIGKGLTVMSASLAVIAGTLRMMTGALPGAAALLVVSFSLGILGEALAGMSEMSWEEIAKGLVTLTGALLVIAGGLYLMTGALPGAAALLVVSGALAILAPVLATLGAMSWGEILTALGALAGVFLVLGAAGLLLTPVIPTLWGLAGAMLALGAAALLLGAGVLAFGAGIALLAAGLTSLALSGAAVVTTVIAIIAALLGAVPMILKILGEILIGLMDIIIEATPKIVKAIVTIVEELIKALVRITPKLVDALLRMLTMLLQKLSEYVPKMVDAGLKLLTGILRGIANNIGKVADQATRVVVEFLNALGRNLPKIVDAGMKMIINFVNGTAKAIRENTDAMNQAGRNLAGAIIEGMVKGLASGVSSVASAARSVASSAYNSAKDFLGINSPSKEFEKLGKFVNDGFVKGLDGNKEQVYKAFNDLKTMLKDLSKNSKASASERKKAASAYTTLTKSLNDEKTAIGKLADKYDVLTEKIKKADEAYQAAVKTRDDYKKSVTDQYSDMASATGETTLAGYTEDLKKQIEDTKLFSNALQRLRAFGLNDEMYKDLLATGTDALPFVNELLNGGKASIDEINKLGKELDAVGSHLGKSASTALYQAGVDSAKGVVEGLKREQANIEKQMDKIAAAMVKSIKKKLGIKSPSRVFMEVGGYSAQGLAKGMDEMSGIVERSAERTGTAAVESLRKSISGFSDLITQDVDTQPIITPVLDLSSIKKESGRIGGMFGNGSISVDSSYSKARYVASEYARNQAVIEDSEMAAMSPVSYVQNNYSPKALSSADIYRQTKNQLSTTKGALT